MKTVAIGDVHGCYTQLKEVIGSLRDTGVEVLFLGDLFDRSPEPDGDHKVLHLVRELQSYPERFGIHSCRVLAGNHEMLLLDAIETNDTELWEWNGGNIEFLEEAREHYEWLADLPLWHKKGKYLFVHAGVRPGVPLEKQTRTDLTWIRDPFLNCEDHGLPHVVVHGHTIVDEVEIYPHRIALDTGCFHTGKLSYMEFEDDDFTMGSDPVLQGSENGRDRECALTE